MAPEIKNGLEEFQINTCRTLNATGVDGVHTILPMIHGIATLMCMGFRKDDNGDAALANANPELVAATFEGIGFLAATAMLHADRL